MSSDTYNTMSHKIYINFPVLLALHMTASRASVRREFCVQFQKNFHTPSTGETGISRGLEHSLRPKKKKTVWIFLELLSSAPLSLMIFKSKFKKKKNKIEYFSHFDCDNFGLFTILHFTVQLFSPQFSSLCFARALSK